MRGAPQSGFSRLILRMSWRVSAGMVGRPGRLGRDFQVQKRRNALRCQAMTVSGRTITSAERQLSQTVASVAQSNRSDEVSLGRLTERCRTPS